MKTAMGNTWNQEKTNIGRYSLHSLTRIKQTLAKAIGSKQRDAQRDRDGEISSHLDKVQFAVLIRPRDPLQIGE